MARLVKTVSKTTGVMLELTGEEAEVLCALTGGIAGLGPVRNAVDDIRGALYSVPLRCYMFHDLFFLDCGCVTTRKEVVLGS